MKTFETSGISPQVLLAKGGSWHETELIRRGFSTDGLAKARGSFGIVAWRDQFGGWHYPKWQFGKDGSVLPEVMEILQVLRSSDFGWAMYQFLLPEKPERALIDLVLAGLGKKAVGLAKATMREIRARPTLSSKQIADLNRQVAEMDDPVRYVIVSSVLREWSMIYNINENVYCGGHVSEGCLVKEQRLAEAIAKHVTGRGRKSSLHVIPVRKTKTGYRALKDVPGARNEKSWRPRFKTPNSTPFFVPITERAGRGRFLDAMVFVAQNREAILALVAASKNRKAAAGRLVKKCGLSEREANAVLEMRMSTMHQESVDGMISELRSIVAPEKS